MRARKKYKRVFQHQSRTSIPPDTTSDEVYDGYKYHYKQDCNLNNEDISTAPRGDLRSEYI